MLGKNFYPVILDFKNYTNMGNHVQVQTSQVQKWITGQLNASTALLSMKPDTLEYYNVSAGEQYYLPDTLFTPDSVRVYAPSDALDTMKVAYTLPLNLDNITDTLEREVTLSAPKGAKYIPASVKLTLPVDMYTEKTVEVPLRGVNFPADKVLRAFPSKIKISFQVGMGRFRQITADDFHLVVSYEELVRLGSEKYTVKLRTLPEGVSHVRFNPEQVDFLIEQIPADYIPVYISDIETRRLMVSDESIRRGLTSLLGENVYIGENLNKPLLASYLFGSAEHAAQVNAIVHPRVKDDFRLWCSARSAILLEAGFRGEVDKVVMVYAPLEVRIQRAVSRDASSRDLIEQRIRRQMDDEEKRRMADYVIVNDGNSPLIPQVLALISSLSKNIDYLCER